MCGGRVMGGVGWGRAASNMRMVNLMCEILCFACNKAEDKISIKQPSVIWNEGGAESKGHVRPKHREYAGPKGTSVKW